MAKLTEEQLVSVLKKASKAAVDAAAKTISDNPNQWYPCGFAWVRIKPARGQFVNFLKKMEVGRTDEYEGGYVIYNPSQNNTQWMDAKYDGAKAFAAVLQEHGIKARAECRMD